MNGVGGGDGQVGHRTGVVLIDVVIGGGGAGEIEIAGGHDLDLAAAGLGRDGGIGAGGEIASCKRTIGGRWRAKEEGVPGGIVAGGS